MAIVTIISDYGNKDHYVPALKGALLSVDPSFQIIDITHDIPLFNIREAAYNSRSSFYRFPKNTIHLLCVAEEPRDDNSIVILNIDNHYFIGVDNGLPSLIIRDRTDYKAYIVDAKIVEKHSHMIDIYTHISRHLNKGGKPNVIGREVRELKEVNLPNPILGENNSFIKGSVQYIDHFGNLVSNITETLFNTVGGNKTYKISIPRERETIKKVYSSFKEVNSKDRLIAIFNSEGWLEIALINPESKEANSAHSLMGIGLSESITIEFE